MAPKQRPRKEVKTSKVVAETLRPRRLQPSKGLSLVRV